MIIKSYYRYFDRYGARNLPDIEFVSEKIKSGTIVSLYLDANVCMDLSNFSRRVLLIDAENRARSFLLSIIHVGIDVVPFFGCLELSSNSVTGEIDKEKNRIISW